MANGEIVLYTTEDGAASIQLRTQDGTVWLTQAEIAELFQTTPQNITTHLRAIYADNEPGEEFARILAMYSDQIIEYTIAFQERKSLSKKTLLTKSYPLSGIEQDEFMKFIGFEADAPELVKYVFDTVLELYIDPKTGERRAKTLKDRSNRLPVDFEFNWETLVKYIGIESLNRPAVQFSQVLLFSATNLPMHPYGYLPQTDRQWRLF